MNFLTSDTHFSERNVIKKSERPFKTVEEMDNVLLDNINSIVGQNDILYHLGDFSSYDIDNAEKIRKRIICKNIFLIAGNHDTPNFCNKFNSLFYKINNMMEIKFELLDRLCILNHYPMRIWNRCDKGAKASIHLHGHLHGILPIPSWHLSLDVGVDAHNYKPWSEKELLEYFQPRFEEFIKQKRNRVDF